MSDAPITVPPIVIRALPAVPVIAPSSVRRRSPAAPAVTVIPEIVFATIPDATVVAATVPVKKAVGAISACAGEAAARVAPVPPPAVVLVAIAPKKPETPEAQTPVPAGVRASERHTPPPAVIVVDALEVSDCAHATTPPLADLLLIVNEPVLSATALIVNVAVLVVAPVDVAVIVNT
jgi:hypothetical protein